MARITSRDKPESVYLRILRTQSEPILFENSEWFILFAKRPCNEGHLLIIPKLQVPNFYELPNEILQNGFEIATQLSRALDEIYKPPRVAMFIKGFTNDDHAHIHVAPAFASEDLDKDLSRPELTVHQMNILASKLSPSITKALADFRPAAN